VRYSVTDVDLGVCKGRVFDQSADGWAIVLPGAIYLPDAPLLWFAREAALAAGRNVLAVWDTFDGQGDATEWVEERAEAAIRHVGANRRPVVIAKSLTSLAARLAGERNLPAVWLTPLLSGSSHAELVVAGLSASTAPCLLIGGSADNLWDGDTARSIASAEILEIADADHALQIPGDPTKSIEALRTVTEAIARFLHERVAQYSPR
jgi:hypothetical protein